MLRTLSIVDDDPGFRAFARALSKAEGFDVVGEAEDGRSAVEAARRLEPDVVLRTWRSRTSTASPCAISSLRAITGRPSS